MISSLSTDSPPDAEQLRAEFHHLPVGHADLFDHAVTFRVDLVHQLHSFHDAQGLALFHPVAQGNIGQHRTNATIRIIQ